MATRKKTPAELVPHSWGVDDWPQTIYPNDARRARYLVRAHKTELLNEGALTRVGRELVIIGAAYARFLAKQAEHVAAYDIAPNRAA